MLFTNGAEAPLVIPQRRIEENVETPIPCPLVNSEMCKVGGGACTLQLALTACGVARDRPRLIQIVVRTAQRHLQGDVPFLGEEAKRTLLTHMVPLIGKREVIHQWQITIDAAIRSWVPFVRS